MNQLLLALIFELDSACAGMGTGRPTMSSILNSSLQQEQKRKHERSWETEVENDTKDRDYSKRNEENKGPGL
jgi:hypothetical protein